MERDLYLTEAPFNETPDSSIIPQKEKTSIALKSLNNPNDRRNQISKKVLSDFPPQTYYDDKKIKPGISLYKVILQTQDRRREGSFAGPFLQLNIHPTIALVDNFNTMIYSECGVIKTFVYASYQKYMSALNISEQQVKTEQTTYPLIMIKCCNGLVFQNNILMNNEISSKIVPRSENVISTRFILPFASYPNVIRLFYTPKHIKSIKKNIAFKIINRKQMTQDCFKKKHRLSNQFMVNIDNEDSYIATLIKGKALQPCQSMASSLCEYLQQALMIKVSEVVIDFIVDENKNIFFNDIKSIKSKCKTKLWQIGSQEQIIKMASENNNQIMCRLCGMLYTKQEMEKIVTNKLIYELASHLQNRGNRLSNIPHMKKQGLSSVCHLCYELIKAEHTLINVERQFSKLMNIRQNTVERVQSKETKQHQLFFYDEEEFQMLGEQTSKYKKWRLFFYVEKLKRIPELQMCDSQNVQILLQMKFQNQKQKFTKKIANQNYDPANIPQLNLSKNWSKSLRSANQNQFKRQSSQGKVGLRIQSAMPFREKYKEEKIEQDQQTCKEQELLEQREVVYDKNKSYFNEQTTCVTHSQSYFSNGLCDRSHIQSNNNTILHRNNPNMNSICINNLDCLNEDSREDENNNIPMNLNLHKKGSQTNQILNCSSVPSNVDIDKVKMFIFYTKAHESEGKNILNDEELQFTLSFTGVGPSNSYGKEHPTFKFQGKSSTLKNLKNKQTCQRHSLQIYLFDHGMKYCNLELTVGMVCDGAYDDEGLDLQKNNNLYWGKTYSCSPLPDQWMQVFTKGQEFPKGNPEKVLQYLQVHNFSTSPKKLQQKTNCINYLKEFEEFTAKTNKEFNLVRPMSSIPQSKSTALLKKSSIIRCKTALNRNGNSYSNLLTQQSAANSNRRRTLKGSGAKQDQNQNELIEENELLEFDY